MIEAIPKKYDIDRAARELANLAGEIEFHEKSKYSTSPALERASELQSEWKDRLAPSEADIIITEEISV